MLPKIKSELALQLSKVWNLDSEQIRTGLEIPKKFEHGHLAFPVFFLAKEMRKAPPVIAQELCDRAQGQLIGVEELSPLSGFVNFRFSDEYIEKVLFDGIDTAGEKLGHSTFGEGKRLVIDYSSPNVAKPMHIGHLRATVVGQAIRNLAESQGYDVIGVNHLGDWGTQFGKLAWAYIQWADEYDFVNDPIESLLKLYVRFHDEADKDPEIEKHGAATFRRLEEGDQEIVEIWKKIVDLSMADYNRIWGLLGVKHDLVLGESFYNDRMEPVVEELRDKALLKESDGAQVVFLDDKNMPPCLIKKSDGASLYATRDLACAIYRHDELKADLNVYVTGSEQSLHFQQVFEVLRKMGRSWVDGCVHVSFGMYRFKDMGKMSSRRGQVIRLKDMLDKSFELVEKIIDEKNPELEGKADVIRQVAVGAIVFNDLVNDRVKNVEFDWDKALSFEGDSGPYVQYMHVRCVSLIRKYGKQIQRPVQGVLSTTEERHLISLLLRFPETLTVSFDQFKPHILANYLLDLCQAFSLFYHKNRILGEAQDIEASRMALVEATRKVLEKGLAILSIEAPQSM